MPQGQAAVTWSDRKDVELFLTVLAVQKINIDYNAVAAAFGPNVPASCIQSRMKILRKRSAELGITPTQDSPAKTPSKKRTAPETPTSTAKKSRGKKGALSSATVDINDDDDFEEVINGNHKNPHISSDAGNVATEDTKTNNNGDYDDDDDDDDNNNNIGTQKSLPPKRKTAKPRAPRAKSIKPKKGAAPSTLEEDEGIEDGGVEMEFIKEEIKVEDEDDNQDNMLSEGLDLPLPTTTTRTASSEYLLNSYAY